MKKILSRLTAVLLALTLLTAPACALTVEQALELLERHFYYEIPDAAYQAGSLDELMGLLGDPYARYYTPAELEETLNPPQHNVDAAGIGVTVTYTLQGILVEGVVEGNSAQEAGIRPGDLIIAVDGVSCVPAGASHRSLILGKEGTRVTVTVLRDGETRDYVLTRRSIYVPSSWTELLDGGVGYVKCTSFEQETAGLLLKDLRQYDGRVNCWVLDLRGNGGGFVDTALEMTGALSGPGYYIYEEYRGGALSQDGYDQRAAAQKPLIVLVDGGSASASELLTANLRDTGRAVIIGERTYGKGIGQSIFTEDQYPDYFEGDGLKFTTFRYYTGGGTSPHYIGVIPTLLVEGGGSQAVAMALTGGRETDARLCILLGSTPFYVDPDTPDDVLAALLEALPPQLLMYYSAAPGAAYEPCQPAAAAEKLGLSYRSRWFSDVADSAYADEINAMGVYQLLNGTAPNVFSPRERLTRAQLCVMLARLLNVSYRGNGPFSDVSKDVWYGPSVNAMAALGLVNGVGEGRFDPDGTLTQQEFLTIMGRTARYLHVALNRYGSVLEEGEMTLSPAQKLMLANWADWAELEVAVLAWGPDAVLYGSGDMLYTSLSDIDPSAPILREEAAAGMYAVLSRLELVP